MGAGAVPRRRYSSPRRRNGELQREDWRADAVPAAAARVRGDRPPADDLYFRYTHDVGRRDAGWEDRKASIIVTRQSVIIHKNEKLGLEINPRTRRFVRVRRDGNRVRISAGGGGSAESWSFTPPDDAAGWANDIRAVIKARRAG